MWNSEQDRDQDQRRSTQMGNLLIMKAGPEADLSGGEGLCEVLRPVYIQVKCIVFLTGLIDFSVPSTVYTD